eukprot:gnl/Trimastix_PCT/1509.p1 GENE.gnl/Trimastix_PCT/1509~~gnl/Trimastix_PCT/1509.p1  ORF type:complete len:179 (+),score=12.25 gnl/Trimastix_PCT/1509:128-664(+)
MSQESTSNQITILDETPDHIETIRTLQYRAFTNHPQHAPGAEPTEHQIVDRLRTAGALTLSLVAMQEGIIVGHAALSPLTLNEDSASWLGLGPIGILPDQQRKGIGSQLMNECIRRCRAMSAIRGIVLIGDPAFYTRFGFRSYDKTTVPGIPQANVLALSLDGTEPEGIPSFHPAFFG